MTNYVHVEVLNYAFRPIALIAMPIRYARIIPAIKYLDGWYTIGDLDLVLQVPGSFVIKRGLVHNQILG